ncbi:hypothetical protein ACIA49_19130 [Kribbella sp. NPDC051587]|uniref:hypothetical protein n=1 Tax=Kribbella sp. NPDC051587 TaxID=3364119 RepID=UPI00379403EC
MERQVHAGFEDGGVDRGLVVGLPDGSEQSPEGDERVVMSGLYGDQPFGGRGPDSAGSGVADEGLEDDGFESGDDDAAL